MVRPARRRGGSGLAWQMAHSGSWPRLQACSCCPPTCTARWHPAQHSSLGEGGAGVPGHSPLIAAHAAGSPSSQPDARQHAALWPGQEKLPHAGPAWQEAPAAGRAHPAARGHRGLAARTPTGAAALAQPRRRCRRSPPCGRPARAAGCVECGWKPCRELPQTLHCAVQHVPRRVTCSRLLGVDRRLRSIPCTLGLTCSSSQSKESSAGRLKRRKRSTPARPKRSQSAGATFTASAQLKPVLKPQW